MTRPWHYSQVLTVPAAEIDAAAKRLADVLPVSPLQRNERLSKRANAQVWLKREDLQPVRSYKGRGAYNVISQLPATARRAGVVCASAGNHGQGVAYACRALGVAGRVYLPRNTPRQKRDRIAEHGGKFVEIVVAGESYDEAATAAHADAARTGATLVPAFDDLRTIAGQGTVIAEIVDQLNRPPDIVIVPVGGGGLLAGSVAWLAERSPGVQVIGIEPAGAACMAAALKAGHPVDLSTVDQFVDGAAVRRAGELTYPLVRDSTAQLFSVAEGAVCVEMLELYQSEGIIAEPAGALASAALGALLRVPADSTVVCILSGGNNDVSRYGEVVERALIHEGRKHYFLVNFPQEPGALRRFLDEVLGPDDDITLFEYTKRNNRETGPAIVGIELGSLENLAGLLERMRSSPVDIEQVPSDGSLFRMLV